MDYGQTTLSKACKRCSNTACVRCKERTCLSCQQTFQDDQDHRDVEMIVATGLCVECALALTEKHKIAAETKCKEKSDLGDAAGF